MPSRLVPVRARVSSSPTVIGWSVTCRRQFSHMTSDTSQAPSRSPDAPWLVVRCGRRCSASLSNSIVNATSAWDSRAERKGVAGWGADSAGDVGCLNCLDALDGAGAWGARGPALALSSPAERSRSRLAAVSARPGMVRHPVRASRSSAWSGSNVDLAGSPRAATAAWKRARAPSSCSRDRDTLMARRLPGRRPGGIARVRSPGRPDPGRRRPLRAGTGWARPP